MRYRKTKFFTTIFCIIGIIWAGSGAGIQVSWVYPYHNFTAMYQDSDIVIRGVTRESYQPSLEWRTIHQITILEMIKGEKPAHVISVPQRGGYYLPGKIVEPASFPLYHKGDELILFLKQSKKEYEINTYYGGPQGSYKVVDGKVYPSGVICYSALNSSGMDVEQFIMQLKELE